MESILAYMTSLPLFSSCSLIASAQVDMALIVTVNIPTFSHPNMSQILIKKGTLLSCGPTDLVVVGKTLLSERLVPPHAGDITATFQAAANKEIASQLAAHPPPMMASRSSTASHTSMAAFIPKVKSITKL